MSSIAGIYFRNQRPVSQQEIDQVLDSLLDWKPDLQGSWIEGSVGLGGGLFFTTPQSCSEQVPLVKDRGNQVLVADLRLDNRDVLLSQLGWSAEAGDTTPDSELLLAAYERWGEACVDYLLGDFAFAIWDARRAHLFCARDTLGIRPFFYYVDEKVFLFASEMRGIFAAPGAPSPQHDELVLALHTLGASGYEKERTVYQDIRCLPPGHCLKVDRNHVVSQKYWEFNLEKEVRFERVEAYAEEFEHLLKQAVDCRMRSAYRVGTFLSGGVDSSAVTGFAMRSPTRSQKLLSYSWALAEGDEGDGPCGDERAYIEKMKAFLPELDHHYIVNSHPFEDADFDPLIPYEGPRLIMWRNPVKRSLYALAREHGVRCLLGGDFGDDAASWKVPDYHLSLVCRGKWLEWLHESRCESQYFGLPLYSLMKNGLMKSYHRKRGRFNIMAQRVAAKHADLSRTSFRKEFYERSGVFEWLDEHFPEIEWKPGNMLRINAQFSMTRGSHHYFAPMMQSLANRYHVELSYPLIDRRVLEFCLAVPIHAHRRDGWGRRLLRDATPGYMPEEICWRWGKHPRTIPDHRRRMLQSESYFRTRIETMRKNNRWESYLDLDLMEKQLNQLVAAVSEKQIYRTGEFLRDFLVLNFIDNKE